tara:strand:- start:459 stop:644 length:186 start_codon:yes stop_codon:yes gene_type:complete
MIPLNEHEIAWFNHNRHELRVPEGSSPAAEIFTKHGVHGITLLHKAIIARDINKIQGLLDG